MHVRDCELILGIRTMHIHAVHRRRRAPFDDICMNNCRNTSSQRNVLRYDLAATVKDICRIEHSSHLRNAFRATARVSERCVMHCIAIRSIHGHTTRTPCNGMWNVSCRADNQHNTLIHPHFALTGKSGRYVRPSVDSSIKKTMFGRSAATAHAVHAAIRPMKLGAIL
jgi:hypothetical protein